MNPTSRNSLRWFLVDHIESFSRTVNRDLFVCHVWRVLSPILFSCEWSAALCPPSWQHPTWDFDADFAPAAAAYRAGHAAEPFTGMIRELPDGPDLSGELIEALLVAEVDMAIERNYCQVFGYELARYLDQTGVFVINGETRSDLVQRLKNSLRPGE